MLPGMPMTVHDALEAWSEGRLSTEQALALTGCADVDELLSACDSSDVQRPGDDWHARRAALKARDAALDAGRHGTPAPDVPAGPGDEMPDDPLKVRWRIEDGTGCSSRVQLHVRILVGTERSTVIVSDSVTGHAIDQDVVEHGGEAGAAAAAVCAAVKRLGAEL